LNKDGDIWSWCDGVYTTMLPSILNAFASKSHFWGTVGDNFYDGDLSQSLMFFNQLSCDAKSKILLSVPGNHEYDLHAQSGEVPLSTEARGAYDDRQMYAGDSLAFWESNDPFRRADPNESRGGGRLQDPKAVSWKTGFFANHIGNVFFIGYTGFSTWDTQKEAFQDACTTATDLKAKGTVEWIVVLGHWQMYGTGSVLMIQDVHANLKSLSGCSQFYPDNIKFFAGHTHVNSVILKDTIFQIGANGLDEGPAKMSGSVGPTILDTTEGRIRIWNFVIPDCRKTDSTCETRVSNALTQAINCITNENKSNWVTNPTCHLTLWSDSKK